jgi:N-acetylglucosamine kinase-like BadF-type ATPase
MDYIIGVDGGATKTEVAAYNLMDEKIAESTTGPGNPAVDYRLAEINISHGLSQCLQNINSKGIGGECRGIYMGIAGIEVKDNKSRLEAQIGQAFRCRVIGVHDSELAHAAVFNGKDGIITIAGTGSVSYGRYKGKTSRTGGWGHVLGDEGSGYWIALEALKRMTLEEDLGMTPGNLSRQMMISLGTHSVAEMKDFVHASGKYEIAAATGVVVKSAQNGDREALEILDRAGLELAVMTERLYKKLEIFDPVEIGFNGGILLKVNQVRDSFRGHLESNLDSIIILEKSVTPTKGACHLHRISTT